MKNMSTTLQATGMPIYTAKNATDLSQLIHFTHLFQLDKL